PADPLPHLWYPGGRPANGRAAPPMPSARFRSPLLPAALAALLACTCPCPALGEGRDAWEVAKGHFDRGASLYEAGRFREAEDEFLQAYELSRLPDLLFNLSRAAEKQGRAAQAQEYLERYLRERPQAPDRPQIEADIARLRRLSAPPPIAPVAPAPAPAGSRLPPWPVFVL